MNEDRTPYWWQRDCCYLCIHWDEDARERIKQRIEEWTREGFDLNVLYGFDAPCSQGVPGIEITIHGDATYDLVTEAEFCCPTFWRREDG